MSTEILRPNFNGDTIQFTPIGDTLNWQCVDDVVSDGITTYVDRLSMLAFNHMDLYKIGASLGSGTINKIKVSALIAVGYVNINPYRSVIIKTGGTIFEGTPTQGANNNFYLFTHEWTTNPDTGTRWTWIDISNLQIGFKIVATTDGNALGATCTQIYVEITYGLSILRKNLTKTILISMGKGVK